MKKRDKVVDEWVLLRHIVAANVGSTESEKHGEQLEAVDIVLFGSQLQQRCECLTFFNLQHDA